MAALFKSFPERAKLQSCPLYCPAPTSRSHDPTRVSLWTLLLPSAPHLTPRKEVWTQVHLKTMEHRSHKKIS